MGLSPETKAARKAAGLCTKCGREDALPNNDLGPECRQRVKDSQKKSAAKNKAAGKCVKGCGRTTLPGKAVCVECRKVDDTNRQIRDTNRKAEHRCPHCDELVATGNIYCDEYIAKTSLHKLAVSEERKATGLCVTPNCPNLAEEGSVRCKPCKVQYNSSRQVTYKECCEVGLCYYCPTGQRRPALPDVGYCEPCKIKALKIQKRCRNRRRIQVFDHYGWTCACCGCGIPTMLEIDHIHGGGGQHRKKIGQGQLYHKLIEQDFPPGFQTLCSACNKAKRDKAGCPHVHLSPRLLQQLRAVNAEIAAYWREMHPEDFQAPPKQKGGRRRKYFPPDHPSKGGKT